MKLSNYSWMFEENNYESNLDKLFKIYISSIAHLDCFVYVKEFNGKIENSKQ